MKKLLLLFISIAFVMLFSKAIYAKNIIIGSNVVNVKLSVILPPSEGGLLTVGKDGQLIPTNVTKMNGEISLTITINNKSFDSWYPVIDSAEVDGKVFYKCDNGKFFLMRDQDNFYPFIDHDNSLLNKYGGVDEALYELTKKLEDPLYINEAVWEIWEITEIVSTRIPKENTNSSRKIE